MGNLRFKRNQRPVKFWQLMGPLFASAEVRKSLVTLHDKPETDEWFVQAKGNAVQWSCCLRVSGDSAELAHYWIAPSQRGKDQSSKMTDLLVSAAKELELTSVHIVASEPLVGDLTKRGFAEVSRRGKYIRMEKSL